MNPLLSSQNTPRLICVQSVRAAHGTLEDDDFWFSYTDDDHDVITVKTWGGVEGAFAFFGLRRVSLRVEQV